MSIPLITEQNINKQYRNAAGHKFFALKDIDLTLHNGEFLVLVGPSGCGKSTLLRIMSGLDTDFTGTHALSSELQPDDMGFVFQQFALLPWLTVRENISLGLIARRQMTQADHRHVEELINFFGLKRFANDHPRGLSGGMKQRVGIARALAIKPKVIFMDEPFSALDTFTAKVLREELLSIWSEQKITIVLVTHNIEEAVELGDRIVVMSPRPGKIEQVFDNALPRPRALRTPEFFNLVDKVYEVVRE